MIVSVTGRGVSCLSELAGASADDQQTLANIHSLDLSNNAISSLLRPMETTSGKPIDGKSSTSAMASSSSAVACMSGLQCLDLSRNQLYPSLAGLTAVAATLTELRVPYNKLERLDGLERCTSLVLLDISHNNIRSLAGLPRMEAPRPPSSRAQKTQEEGIVCGLTLLADYNQLTSKALGELERTVGPALTDLSMQHNKLEDGAVVLRAFFLVGGNDEEARGGGGGAGGYQLRCCRFARLQTLNLSWNAFLCNGSIETALRSPPLPTGKALTASTTRTLDDPVTLLIESAQPVQLVLDGFKKHPVMSAATAAGEPQGHQSPVLRKSMSMPSSSTSVTAGHHHHNYRTSSRSNDKPAAHLLDDQDLEDEGVHPQDDHQQHFFNESCSSSTSAGARIKEDVGEEDLKQKMKKSIFYSSHVTRTTSVGSGGGVDDDDAMQPRHLLHELEAARMERDHFARENKTLRKSLSSLKQVVTVQMASLRSAKEELAAVVERSEVLQRQLQRKVKEQECLAKKCREFETLLHQSELHKDIISRSQQHQRSPTADTSSDRTATLHVTADNTALFTTKDLLECLSLNRSRSSSMKRMDQSGGDRSPRSASFLRNVTNSTLSRSKDETRAAFGFESSSSCNNAEHKSFLMSSESKKKSTLAHAHWSYREANSTQASVEEQMRYAALVAKHRIEHELYNTASRRPARRNGSTIHHHEEERKERTISPEAMIEREDACALVGLHRYPISEEVVVEKKDAAVQPDAPRVQWAVTSGKAAGGSASNKMHRAVATTTLIDVGNRRGFDTDADEDDDHGGGREGEEGEEEVRRLRQEVAALRATCEEQSAYIDDLSRENEDVLRKYELTVDSLVTAHQEQQQQQRHPAGTSLAARTF